MAGVFNFRRLPARASKITIYGRILRLALAGSMTFSTLGLWAVPISHFERHHHLISRDIDKRNSVETGNHVAPAEEYVRLNQVGYAIDGPKVALLMATSSTDAATFTVENVTTGRIALKLPIGAPRGPWSDRYTETYPLDFSTLETAGTYRIRILGAGHCVSSTFRVDDPHALFRPAFANALTFFQAQRDGLNVVPTVMSRKPAHLNDRFAFVYNTPPYRWIAGDETGEVTGAPEMVGGPVDVAGGWFDAGDYLKFVETASFDTTLMWLAADRCRHLPSSEKLALVREARYGTDWLLKMWDGKTQTLYYQVGIGDGNNDMSGDHDIWRLPNDDDDMPAAPGDKSFFVKYRPVFRAGPPGSRISPNLAGRMAATFAMAARESAIVDRAYSAKCAQAACEVYALSDTEPKGHLTTASIFEYYPEVEWRDDMTLGATELYRMSTALGDATAAVGYLHDAAHWASQYLLSPHNGTDSLNLYDCGGLADYDLCRVLTDLGHEHRASTNPADDLEVSASDLRDDLRDQIRNGIDQAHADPFRLAVRYDLSVDQTAHALGLAIEATLYRQLIGGDRTYTPGSPAAVCREFADDELNWVLGENAWGSSFIIGDGVVYPIHPHHQIANLTVGPNGKSPVLLGAAVNGPAPLTDIPDDNSFSRLAGMRYAPDYDDEFLKYSNSEARYVDRVDASQCVEPCDDCTALSLLLFALLAGD
jgi:hypothetical protein